MVKPINTPAELIDRGCGMIYDTVLDITWLADADYAQTSSYDSDGKMDWASAVAWASQLSYCAYDDWRLPRTLPVNGTDYVNNLAYDGTADVGYNIVSPSSELAYMFAVNLGNRSYYDTSGAGPQPGYGLTATGPFVNVHEYYYWSETELTNLQDYSWGYSFIVGGQRMYYQPSEHYAWAVRDGDVQPTGDIAPRGSPDGNVDVADYLLARSVLLGETIPTTIEQFHADLYQPGAPDGIIGLSDVVLLRSRTLSATQPLYTQEPATLSIIGAPTGH
jgi:hypothetical protein